MNNHAAPSPEKPDYVHPPANLQVITWLFLLGVPLLLVFLILYKTGQKPQVPQPGGMPLRLERPAGHS